MKKKQRPYVLTVAGFDPSGGAGLLADVKTLEQLKCYGLGLCTANTIQTDKTFESCHWTPIEQIKKQLEIIIGSYPITAVKIGVVENWEVLKKLLILLHAKVTDVPIVLDPVLRSSSGFEFHKTDESRLYELLDYIHLITPNYNELNALYGGKVQEGITQLQAKTNILLKGGHNDQALGVDMLYMKNGKQFQFSPKGNDFSDKHGSGCILSSAITGYLALGLPIMKACFRAKRYTEQRLQSNKTQLAYHH